MGKVIYRLPSKGTQYGYAEYHFDYDGDPYTLGHEYRSFVTDFTRGEADEQKLEKDTKVFKPSEVTAKKVEYEVPISQEQAIAILDEGLGVSVYDEPVEEQAPEWEAPPAAPSEDDWEF